MKKRILWYSDFLCPTGFGNVAEAIVSRLKDKYAFTVLGINHFGEPYNIPGHPYYHLRDIPVYPARDERDYLGRQKLLDVLHAGRFDTLFILQDTFNLVPLLEPIEAARADFIFNYVLYFPVDADLDADWVQVIEQADRPVAYTKYGQQKALEHGLQVPYIYHGVDLDIFKPLLPAERTFCRAQYMSADDKDFIITNVNRNQHRKDLPRTILAFVQIKKQIPKAKLYLHTEVDNRSGHDLEHFVKIVVPEEMRNSIILPNPEQMRGFGVSTEIMRRIYCCSDVVISTSRGEGWGLSTTEAMACKVPVVMPRHTSFVEIVGQNEERGTLVSCNEIDVNIQDNNRIRPVVDIDDLVQMVRDVYDLPEQHQQTAEEASVWVREHCDWNKIAAQWDEILGAE
jgi:glycosyltransferase involved in cell wall biosynthesis